MSTPNIGPDNLQSGLCALLSALLTWFAVDFGSDSGTESTHIRKGFNMSKKVVAAIAGWCAHRAIHQMAVRNGLQGWQVALLASIAGTAASAAVMSA
ncbi:hypothetical protein [Streptomyces sp. NPDC005953]|uniref:hypothetical protein n=1 Tax=Streptomyces sp. NPDC005953 TaxID=3156719 RepID=UPI0033C8F10A